MPARLRLYFSSAFYLGRGSPVPTCTLVWCVVIIQQLIHDHLADLMCVIDCLSLGGEKKKHKFTHECM